MTPGQPVDPGTRDATTSPTAPHDTRPQGAAAAVPLYVGPLEEPDRYELLGEGVRGGEGVTWRARYVGRLQTPITVAVKLLRRPDGAPLDWPSREDQQRWRDHRALLAHLDVPHLVRLHDVFAGPAPHKAFELSDPQRSTSPLGDCAYLVMEWVEGGTLDDLVRGTGPSVPALVQRLTVVQQLCQASHALRSQTRSAGNPLLHRDIKPSNCIVHPERGAVLIDLTTARALNDGHDPLGLATVQYCAPEVLGAPTAPREYPSEVYALGAVAAFCVLGSDPPHIASGPALLALERDLQNAATAMGVQDPAVLAQEITRALNPDPLRRPDDVREWSSGLLRAATGRDPLAVPGDPFGPGASAPPAASSPGRRSRRGAVLVAAVLALVLVVGATALLLTRRNGSDGAQTALGGSSTGASAQSVAAQGIAGTGTASASGAASPTDLALPSGTATAGATTSPTSGPSASVPPTASAAPTAVRTSAKASPTRAPSRSAAPTVRPTTASPKASVTVASAATGRILDPGTGAQVQQCSIFAGTATLPAGQTLVLLMHNLDNGDSRSYAENVFGWSSPKPTWSWRGPQYFAFGTDDAVGQRYTVTLVAAPIGEVAAQLDSNAAVRATALAGSWTVLDTITVSRIAGVPAAGCSG